jgi:methionyl-tRNA synthetase
LNPQQKFPEVHPEQLAELIKMETCKILFEKLAELPDKCRENFNSYQFHFVVDSVMATLHAANGFFESAKPWELKKGNEEAIKKLETIISIAMESLRISAIILQPIIPDFTAKLLQRLNIHQDHRLWKDTKINLRKVPQNLVDLESNILFKRIILETEKQGKVKSEKPTNKRQRV